MMAPKGPPAKGAGGPIPGADALGTVEDPLLSHQPPPPRVQGYQEARRRHPLLLCRAASSSMERGIQRRQAAPGYWEKLISTPINPVSVFNDSTRVNCAKAPTHAAIPRTTPTISC